MKKAFPPSPLRLITISGLSVAGKDTITNLLAPKVGWPVLSVSQIMRQHCKKTGSKLPTTPDLKFNQQIEDLIQKQIATAEQLILASNRTAGYHAWQYKQKYPHSADQIFSILITAPQRIRVQRIINRDKLSPKEAQEHVVTRDQIDLQVYRQLFGINPLNPKYFDLIINTSQLTPSRAVKQILGRINLETNN